MTWGNPPKLEPTKPKKGKVVTPEDLAKSGTEDGHQAAVMCWAALSVGKYKELKWLHSIPNGGQRNIIEATKMVSTGTRGGIWDLFLPLPIHTEWAVQYAGLYIEMKKPERRKHKDGGLSKEQLEFGAYAEKMGYFCAVCYSWEEARDILIKYVEVKV